MALARGPQDTIETKITHKIIEKVVEVPKFVEKIVEVPVYREKIIEIPVIREVEKIVEVVVIKEVIKLVEVPKYVTKEVIDVKITTQPLLVRDVKVVEQIMHVSKPEIKIKYIEEVVRVPKVVYDEIRKEIIVPVLVEKDVPISKPRFIEKTIEVIKPKYVCQKCGHEVV